MCFRIIIRANIIEIRKDIDLMKNSHRRREIEKNKIYIITQVEI